MKPLWRVTVEMTAARAMCFGGEETTWRQVCNAIESKSQAGARWQARQLCATMWPTAKLRVKRVQRDRKAEARR